MNLFCLESYLFLPLYALILKSLVFDTIPKNEEALPVTIYYFAPREAHVLFEKMNGFDSAKNEGRIFDWDFFREDYDVPELNSIFERKNKEETSFFEKNAPFVIVHLASMENQTQNCSFDISNFS